ncbi:MAG TPA: ADP-ribosylglycohydrolase family protein [Acidimicrobiia bacterium]|nr:ADP-ribosylglycohydrolase family protein [Acidimicrobiia bacterium]
MPASSSRARIWRTPSPSNRVARTEWSRSRTDGFRAKLGALESCLESGDDDQARRRLGNSVVADGSVMTAIYCFLVGSGFEEAIRRALAMGGDTDTIAAMAEAFAGARYGLAAIPSDWRRVEGFDHMVELRERLYRRIGLLRAWPFTGGPH